MRGFKKYILVGDWVNSKHDGEEHYVSSEKLLKLYNLTRGDCYFLNFPISKDRAERTMLKIEIDALIRTGLEALYPRWSGDYSRKEKG